MVCCFTPSLSMEVHMLPWLQIFISLHICCTFHSHDGAVVSLVGAVSAGCVTLVSPLVLRPEPLDDQPDLIVRVPLHPHLAVLHSGQKRGVREALVPGGHHSHLPPQGIVSVQKPLEVLRAGAFVPRDRAGQGEGEACDAVQGSDWNRYVPTLGKLKHWKKKKSEKQWGKGSGGNSVGFCGSLQSQEVWCNSQYPELMTG